MVIRVTQLIQHGKRAKGAGNRGPGEESWGGRVWVVISRLGGRKLLAPSITAQQ